MINQFSIIATVLGATCGAIAVHYTHRWAKADRWGYVERFVCGGLIIILTFAPILFATVDPVVAGFLLGMLVILFGVVGITTWNEHNVDHQEEVSGAIEGAEQLNRRIRKELEK